MSLPVAASPACTRLSERVIVPDRRSHAGICPHPSENKRKPPLAPFIPGAAVLL
jgi:hypothetical protein